MDSTEFALLLISLDDFWSELTEAGVDVSTPSSAGTVMMHRRDQVVHCTSCDKGQPITAGRHLPFPRIKFTEEKVSVRD